MIEKIVVDVATLRVARNLAKLTCLSLGSCLGIALYEHRAKIGGLAHPMLPWFEEGRNKRNPARYVDTSIYLMIDEIIEMGGRRHSIHAKLVGGARMFPPMALGTLDIGKRNIEAARETLGKEHIRIKAEDVGGTCGRTMTFDVRTGTVQVRTPGKETKTLIEQEDGRVSL